MVSNPTKSGAVLLHFIVVIFRKNQISRILDAIFSSQISARCLDSRIHITAMCGDQIPVQGILNSILVYSKRLVSYACGKYRYFKICCLA